MMATILLLIIAVVYRVTTGIYAGADQWLPNFAPVAAIALCGPCLFPRRVALLLPLAILFASDLMLNLHYGVAWLSGEMVVRYAALLAVAAWGLRLARQPGLLRFVPASMAGSTVFYLATNTAAWLSMPAYAKTVAGWWQALTVGLPGFPPTWMFYRNTLVSDLLFTMLCIGCVALSRLKPTTVATAPVRSPLHP